MSTGSNSDNLLRAAWLLEAQVDMVKESNDLLQVERVRNDANSELRKTLEERVDAFQNEIVALQSQLSEQKLKLDEVVVEAEKKQDELLRRAEEAEARLVEVQNNPAAAFSGETHILVPIATLRLAQAQFESLARAFEKSGNIVSQVMCEASASNLDRTILDASAAQLENRSKHAA